MTRRRNRETKVMVDKREAWDALTPTTPSAFVPPLSAKKKGRFCKVSQYISKKTIPRNLMDRHRNRA